MSDDGRSDTPGVPSTTPARARTGACGVHPDREAVDVCGRCRRELCLTCAQWLAGATYCPDHFGPEYRRRSRNRWLMSGGILLLIASVTAIVLRADRQRRAEEERYGTHKAEIERLRVAVEKDVCNRPNATALADHLSAAGFEDEALAALSRVVDRCPPDRQTTERVLELYRKAGDRPNALALAERYVKDHPEAAVGYAVRGALALETGGTAQARQDLEQAVTLNPGHEDAALALADLVEPTDGCRAADVLDDLLGFASPKGGPELRVRANRLRERGRCPRERIEGGKAVVPFVREDDVMIVEVLVNDMVKAKMILDTGASSVALTAEFAERAGLDWRSGERFYVGTAGGVTTARRVKLDSLMLGPARVDGVQASVVSAMDFDDGTDGLLGNTFLSHFEIVVNAEARTVTLTPRQR
ncbi:MAG: TIGR02281 family clan AA aspartic protease [Myxococcales bacterium]|nr:TIGR02281 family clan AA aspartic protease [Myxococcales bacterium]